MAPTVSTGHAALDEALPGGGWPLGELTELLVQQWGCGEIQLLAQGVRAASAFSARETILIAPPFVPCASAWKQGGVQLSRMTVLQPAKAVDALWAAEQVLKSGMCATLLLWCTEAVPEQLRRLQWAAQESSTFVVVMRPASAIVQPSPAPLRMSLQPLAGRRLAIGIPKRRGPPLAHPIVIDLPRPLPLKIHTSSDRIKMVGSFQAVIDALDRCSSPEPAARSADALA